MRRRRSQKPRRCRLRHRRALPTAVCWSGKEKEKAPEEEPSQAATVQETPESGRRSLMRSRREHYTNYTEASDLMHAACSVTTTGFTVNKTAFSNSYF